MSTLLRPTPAVKCKAHEHQSFIGWKTSSMELVILKNGPVSWNPDYWILEKRASVQHKMEVHLGFWLQVFLKAEIIPKLSWFDAPRAHQKTHPQLWRHPVAPLTCFKRRTSHACKILQNIKTLKTSRDCSMAVAGDGASNKQLCGIRLGASCHLINLQSWKVELKSLHLNLSQIDVSLLNTASTRGLVQNTLNPNLAVSNFVAEGPWKQPLWIAGSDFVSLMFLHGGIQTLGKSEGTECASTI